MHVFSLPFFFCSIFAQALSQRCIYKLDLLHTFSYKLHNCIFSPFFAGALLSRMLLMILRAALLPVLRFMRMMLFMSFRPLVALLHLVMMSLLIAALLAITPMIVALSVMTLLMRSTLLMPEGLLKIAVLLLKTFVPILVEKLVLFLELVQLVHLMVALRRVPLRERALLVVAVPLLALGAFLVLLMMAALVMVRLLVAAILCVRLLVIRFVVVTLLAVLLAVLALVALVALVAGRRVLFTVLLLAGSLLGPLGLLGRLAGGHRQIGIALRCSVSCGGAVLAQTQAAQAEHGQHRRRSGEHHCDAAG